MNLLLTVKRGHCALCGTAADLLILCLIAGQPPRLEPKPDNVDAGICRFCWHGIGAILLTDQTYFPAEAFARGEALLHHSEVPS